MILSHRHKFVFIKGIKVAGTSAEIAISQICGPNDIVTPVTPADERHRLGTLGEPRNYAAHFYPKFIRTALERKYVRSLSDATREQLASIRRPRSRYNNHMPLAEVLRFEPAALNYQVIFVERSPYAKVMSLANWKKHASAYASGGSLSETPVTIADAVDTVIAAGTLDTVRNIDRYRMPDGSVSGTLWKAETLGDDIADFCRSRGVDPVDVTHAKRGFGSESVNPAEVLRPNQIALINEVFAEDFETFGWPRIR